MGFHHVNVPGDDNEFGSILYGRQVGHFGKLRRESMNLLLTKTTFRLKLLKLFLYCKENWGYAWFKKKKFALVSQLSGGRIVVGIFFLLECDILVSSIKSNETVLT